MEGAGVAEANWRPISVRRAWRCLEMNLRPQQLSEMTRRELGSSKMFEGDFAELSVIFGALFSSSEG